MRIKLTEVCGVITLLTLTGLCGIANSWDECAGNDTRETAVSYLTWEFKSLLQLDAQQVEHVKTINYEFYDNVSRLYEVHPANSDDLHRQVKDLLAQRTARIMTFLTDKQKTIWQKVNRQLDEQLLTQIEL